MAGKNARSIHKEFAGIDYSGYTYRNFLEKDVTRHKTDRTGNTPCVENVEKSEQKSEEISKVISKWSGRGGAAVVLLVLICFAFTFLAMDFLSGGFFLGQYDNTLFVSKSTAEEGVYYAVGEGAYSDFHSATAAATLVKTRGGAGYVLKNGDTYTVVLSVYDNLKDAESVKNKQTSGATVSVMKLVFNKPSFVGEGDTENEIANDAFSVVDTLFGELSALATEYSGRSSDRALTEKLSALRTKVLSEKNVYVQRSTENNCASVEMLSFFDAVIATLENVDEQANLAAELRYACCQIVCIRNNM